MILDAYQQVDVLPSVNQALCKVYYSNIKDFTCKWFEFEISTHYILHVSSCKL